jgi:UMF1 family MFS transporter
MAANAAFAGSNALYNAFLPGLGDDKIIGRVSGLGWALGYVGGGLCLALNLAMIKSPAAFGLSPAGDLPVRASLLSVAVWWLVFGIPLFLWAPEGSAGSPRRLGRWEEFRDAFAGARARLFQTFRDLHRYRNLATFLAAYVIFNDGIETIILMASIFGARALGMGQQDLILCFLMIQGVAFVGALIFGWLADRVRHKPALFISLAVYVAVLIWAYGMRTSREFWMLGVVVGLVLGGSQSASRSLMALLTPREKSAEFFGFFGVVGKLTAVFGPLLFGAVSQARGLRAGVLSLTAFFVAGGAILLFVKDAPVPNEEAPRAGGSA